MMKRILSLVVLIVLAALLPAAAADTGTGGASPDSLEIGDGANNRLLSLGFIPNVGQYDPVVDYVLHYQDTTVFFMRDGLVLVHTPGSADNAPVDVIRQSFVGASPDTHLTASDQRPGVVNYYTGNDSSKWLSNIPVYSGVVYEDLYPGIDLVYAEENGRLKREFHLAPGADPSQIELLYEGENGPHVDEDGVLRFASPAGEMLESPLVCWQVIGGEKVDRAAEYVVDGGSVRIDVAEYDTGHELVIDPELVYSSYLGGNDWDMGYALAGDGVGGVWVTGYTASPDFPVLDESNGKWSHIAFVSHFASSGTLLSSTCLGGTITEYGHALAGDDEGGVWVMGTTVSTDFPVLNAPQSTYGGSGDAFVSHFSSDGTLLSSTYLGGGGTEIDNALVGDGAGGIWVTGLTISTDFLVTEDAYQSTYGGGSGDAFVTHFSSDGALLSSTYLGGENYDYGSALAGDGAGGVWVMGGNQYGDFPVTGGAFERGNRGGWDVFVSHFASNGTLLSSTCLGGSNQDDGSALAGDGDGGVWVTGETQSVHVPDYPNSGFPVLNAYQGNNEGSYDAFVSHFSSNGTLLYSTYLGGDEHDSGYALAGDGAGGVWVTGDTRSDDFPTLNAHQNAYKGGSSYGDRFVSHFSSEGALLSSTYLGGEGDDCDGYRGREDDHRYTLAGDDEGGVWVTGCTASTAFPVLGDAYQSTYGGGWDAFVSHFSPDGALLLSTYLGGEGDDYGRALAGDGDGGVWVTGYTGSPSFPVLNAYQSSYGGSSDVFVARFGIDDPVPVHPPTANFTANVTSGTAPLTLQFTDTSTGDPTTWFWDFGDGATSTERHPVHTYTAPGTYTVSLTVTSAGGSNTMTKMRHVTVTSAVQIGLGDAAIAKGQTTQALLTIRNASAVAGGSLDLTYDPAVVTVDAVHFASSWSGASSINNTNGKARLAYYSSSGYGQSGDIPVCTVTLRATGEPGDISPLNITVDQLIDDGGKDITSAARPLPGEFQVLYPDIPDPVRYRDAGGLYKGIQSGNTLYFGEEGLNLTCLGSVQRLVHYSNFSAGAVDAVIYVPDCRSFDPVAGGNLTPGRYYAWGSDGILGGRPWVEIREPCTGLDVLLGGTNTSVDGTSLTRNAVLDFALENNLEGLHATPAAIAMDIEVTMPGGGRLMRFGGVDLRGIPVNASTVYARGISLNDTNPGTYTARAVWPSASDFAGKGYNSNTVSFEIAMNTTPPVAAFTANVTSGPSPLTVRFTDTSTGSPTNWFWSFGDGSFSLEQHPIHTYTTPGTYNVSLTATNSAGSNTMIRAGYVTVSRAPGQGILWDVPLSITSGTFNRTVILGSAESATRGFDAELDLPAPPEPPGTSESAYFTCTDPTFGQLSADYKPPVDDTNPEEFWTLSIRSDDPVQVAWNTTLLADSVLSLTWDDGTNTIAMKTTGGTTLPAGSYNVNISASIARQMDLSLQEGWNLVSTPFNNAAYTLPDGAILAIYGYNPSTKGYETVSGVTALVPGEAYWIASARNCTVTVTGAPVIPVTAQLKQGWNLIGSTAGRNAFDGIAIAPTESWAMAFVYGYNPQTKVYVPITELQPGEGYWGAVTRDCTITLP